MKFIRIVCILTTFLYIPMLISDEVITFFFKPYPIIAHDDKTTDFLRMLREPGTIDNYKMHGTLKRDITSGILSTYYGYLGISNANGQTSYPRKTPLPELTIIVTYRLTPNVMTQNTIHHWELEQGTAARMYSLQRKQDQLTNLYYWDVQEVELPEDQRVPLNAIVIFAHPNDVYIPTGITVVQDERPNIVLPTIYVRPGIKIYASSLYVLNIRQFFQPVTSLFKSLPNGYSTLVVPHPKYK